MSRGATAGPSDPLMEEMSTLAKQYGDPEVLRVCLLIISKYANLGATHALGARKGDPSVACPKCREREAQARQIEATLKRAKSGRPLGGASSAHTEGE